MAIAKHNRIRQRKVKMHKAEHFDATTRWARRNFKRRQWADHWEAEQAYWQDSEEAEQEMLSQYEQARGLMEAYYLSEEYMPLEY